MTIGQENNNGLIEEQPGYNAVPQQQQPIYYPQPVYQEPSYQNEKHDDHPNSIRIDVPLPPRNMSEIQMFHIISIICLIVSIFFVFAAFVPMILFCVMRPKLWKTHNKEEELFLLINYIITLVISLCVLIGMIFCIIFSFGLCLIFVVFLIPYPYLCYVYHKLYSAQRQGTLPEATYISPV